MADVARTFIDESRAFLREYLGKIERCVPRLTEKQLWSRSNDASNSVGNLLLHLAGSSRYWAVEVINQKPTGRVRQKEFGQRDPVSIDRLMTDLRAAMKEVDDRLANISGGALLEKRNTGSEEFSVLWCVYHIVEHFSMHTGQIIAMTKALVGELMPAVE